jgi:hypothetical protein
VWAGYPIRWSFRSAPAARAFPHHFPLSADLAISRLNWTTYTFRPHFSCPLVSQHPRSLSRFLFVYISCIYISNSSKIAVAFPPDFIALKGSAQPFPVFPNTSHVCAPLAALDKRLIKQSKRLYRVLRRAKACAIGSSPYL